MASSKSLPLFRFTIYKFDDVTPSKNFEMYQRFPARGQLGIDIANLDSETLCNLLLYGSSNMNLIDNRIIIEATIEYIEKISRLN